MAGNLQRLSCKRWQQAGFTLVELMVSMVISLTVLSGVVSVIVISKSNFLTQRELATLQENARFAIKTMSDEIRMAGYTGCYHTPTYVANSINNASNNWYTAGVGLQGYEYDAGINTFPADFRANVKANTDAIVIGRGSNVGLRITGDNPNSATISVNQAQPYKPGQILVVASAACDQVGIFQVSNPQNNAGTATTIVHNTGASTTPGNCTKNLGGSFNCVGGAVVPSSVTKGYPVGSSVMEMTSEAYYVGSSSTDSTVPALFRSHLQNNTATATAYTSADELVQGIENMQILYGYDSDGDGVANYYLKANSATLASWKSVVSVRLTIRMRSVYPVYNTNVDYGVFEGITGTNGSDRFMRQTVSTTITLRN